VLDDLANRALNRLDGGGVSAIPARVERVSLGWGLAPPWLKPVGDFIFESVLQSF
jgi:hypothetical protein